MSKEIIKNIEEMDSWASSFVFNLLADDKKALIIGLYGDLGSGKTTFVQSVAKVFGVKKNITSPTFVIQKKYQLVSNKFFENLIHIDAYRLEDGEDLSNFDWKESINNPKNIIFIEWPEKISDMLPKDMKKIYFKFIDEQTREIIYEK